MSIIIIQFCIKFQLEKANIVTHVPSDTYTINDFLNDIEPFVVSLSLESIIQVKYNNKTEKIAKFD